MDTPIRKSGRTPTRPIRLIEVLSRTENLSNRVKKKPCRPKGKKSNKRQPKMKDSFTQTYDTLALLVDQLRENFSTQSLNQSEGRRQSQRQSQGDSSKSEAAENLDSNDFCPSKEFDYTPSISN